ncbi:MAG: hypothetical protein ABF489_02170 [Bifidobacterium sp.]
MSGADAWIKGVVSAVRSDVIWVARNSFNPNPLSLYRVSVDHRHLP